MRFTLVSRIFILGLSMALAATGCSDSEEVFRIVSFDATPNPVTQGDAVTLSWVTKGAVAVQLTDENGTRLDVAERGVKAGSIQVRPNQPVTYTLEAVNGAGKKASKKVELKMANPEQGIDSFTARPAAIDLGSSSTLSWISLFADKVELKNEVTGEVVEVKNGLESFKVSPTETTTYTLTAYGEGEPRSAQTTVTLLGPPEIAITSSASSVLPGGGATLTLFFSPETKNVQLFRGEIDITPDWPALISPLTATVSATAPTEFTMVAVSGSGESRDSVTLGVTPVVDSFVVLTPESMRIGNPIEVSWTVRGAESVQIFSDGVLRHTAPANARVQGTAVVALGVDGTIELIASTSTDQVTRSVSVEITEEPRILSFSATPDKVATDLGTPLPVTLSWLADGFDSLELIQVPGGRVAIPAMSEGSMTVQVDQPTTFRLNAVNELGKHSRDIRVSLDAPPTIESFTAHPSLVGVGEAVTLSWRALNSQRIELFRDGNRILIPENRLTGSFTESLAFGATYELRAFGAAYEVPDVREVEVAIGAPQILSFQFDQTATHPGATLGLSWEAVGGVELQLMDGVGEVLFSTNTTQTIMGGTHSVSAPVDAPIASYSLRVTNGVGQRDERTVSIPVIDGPVIHGFTVDRSLVTIGDEITLSWSILDGVAGTPARLTLLDSFGHVHEITGSVGSITIPMEQIGARTFYLSADSEGTVGSIASVTVDIVDVPRITVSATGDYDDPPNPPSVHWVTTGATKITVAEAFEDLLYPIYTGTTPSEVASGWHGVAPTELPSMTYRVTAENAAGATAFGEVTIRVDPAAAFELVLDPPEVLEGDSTEIRWEAHRGDAALSFGDTGPAIQVLAPFIDASLLVAAEEVVLDGSGARLWGEVDFPAGFAFPFDGTNYASVRVMTNGFLSFGSTDEDASAHAAAKPVGLPAPSQDFVHLAPFWAEIDGESGSLWSGVAVEGGEEVVVIQWKEFLLASAAASTLDFEVVLRTDGTFDYRYSTMIFPVNASRSIGFQSLDGSEGAALPEPESGIEGSRFAYAAYPLPRTGSWTFTPAHDATVRLDVVNGHSSDSLEAELRVYPAVQIISAEARSAEPAPGEPFSIRWETKHALAVRVEDGFGVTRCVALPSEVKVGACALTEHSIGNMDYIVIAEGGTAGNEAQELVEVAVFPPFSIDSFTASAEEIVSGESVTIAWTTTNADSMTLTENGVDVDLTDLNLADDELEFSPVVDSTYVLSVTSLDGRTRDATLEVLVMESTGPVDPPEEIDGGGEDLPPGSDDAEPGDGGDI